MKPFKEYVSEAYDKDYNLISTPEKSVKALIRLRQSINSHGRRGGQSHHSRGQDLMRHYDEHADFLKQKHPDVWKKHVKSTGQAINHDASDLYA